MATRSKASLIVVTRPASRTSGRWRSKCRAQALSLPELQESAITRGADMPHRIHAPEWVGNAARRDWFSFRDGAKSRWLLNGSASRSAKTKLDDDCRTLYN